MELPILDEIEQLINEQGSSVLLKEHLSLLNTKIGMLKEGIANLRKENADLIEKNSKLEEMLSRHEAGNKFTELHGAMFKRLSNNRYNEAPYCPMCHRPMRCLEAMLPYECADDHCGHKANFCGSDLKNILAELKP